MASLSTFADAFPGSALDLSKWDTNGAPTVSGGVLTFADGEWIRTVDEYDFDSVYWRLTIPTGKTVIVQVESPVTGFASVTIERVGSATQTLEVWTPTESVSVSATFDNSADGPEVWFRLRQMTVGGRQAVVYEVTTDAAAAVPQPPPWDWSGGNTSGWYGVATSDDGVRDMDLGDVRLVIFGSAGVALSTVNTGLTFADPPPDPPDPPEPSPLDTPPYDYVDDGFTPEDQPAEEFDCASILELVQEFSKLVRRSVRITGPNRIEMVDPVAPLPTGWAQADADQLYTAATQDLAAGQKVLAASRGSLALTSSASVKADDVRLPLSDWRIPDRLPVYGLHPAPVLSVVYTFSPERFTATIEFAHKAVPAEVRRT